MRWMLPLLLGTLLSLPGCGDDGDGDGAEGTSTSESPAASCPGESGQYTGPTSEDLCVTIERDESGAITLLEIEVMASCSAGFGDSEVVLGDVTGDQTLTTSEAASSPNLPFEATMSFKTPISVGADGAFETQDNVTGTVSDSEAQGSYQLQLATFAGTTALTCTGNQVTWTASPAG